jgi:hypothetical protein
MGVFKTKSQNRREEIQGVAKPYYFYRMVKLPAKQEDYWPAYQIEVVKFVGETLDKKFLYGKPDTKQMVLARLQEFMEPDAEFEISPEEKDADFTFKG